LKQLLLILNPVAGVKKGAKNLPEIISVFNRADYDVHVYVTAQSKDATNAVERFAESGADLINFHVEAEDDIKGTIDKIRSLGKKVGLTIKPKTPIDAVVPYLSKVDMVLVMTVEPGYGGQKLMPECIDKVSALREIVNRENITVDIEVDGGITQENVDVALNAGANVIVAGSAVFLGDIEANVKGFLEKM